MRCANCTEAAFSPVESVSIGLFRPQQAGYRLDLPRLHCKLFRGATSFLRTYPTFRLNGFLMVHGLTVQRSRPACWRRAATLTGFVLLLCMAALCEAHTAWTDTRVSQQTIKTTICRRGHLAEVMPSFDEQMRLKAGLLEQRNIPAESATAYALDFRMPVLLGGAPDTPENIDLIPWEGEHGERRKRRFAVFLRHCVCAGAVPLTRAQKAISGDWPNQYPNLWSLTCKDVQ